MSYRISANVIRRLPRYMRRAKKLIAAGVEKISSRELGEQMGFTASQIRQDLNCFGGFGQQGYGYNVKQLKDGVSAALGIDKELTAICIGAGNLGHAIITNFSFKDYGVRLTAVFDIRKDLVGSELGGLPVLHADKIMEYLAENPTDIAILTLPKSKAEFVAKELADCGVRGVWNFTGVDLDNAAHMIVENVHFSDSLLNLGYYLRNEDTERKI